MTQLHIVKEHGAGRPAVILRMLGELTELELLGVRTATGWRFWLRTEDSSGLELLGEELVERHRGPVDTWPQALALLDRCGWIGRVPVEVHPEFRALIRGEAERRLSAEGTEVAHSRRRWWQRACPRPDRPLH